MTRREVDACQSKSMESTQPFDPFPLWELYACPDCHQPLKPKESSFCCSGCDTEFPCVDGIAYLLPARLHSADIKHQELQGWKQIFEENGWKHTPEAILAFPGSREDNYWIKVDEAMPLADAASNARAGIVGVDLACGMGWATARFARRGASMLALDFNDTEYNGLRAAIQLRSRGIHFDAICCDSESIALRDGVADFVFICSALHHFTRPEVALQECRRILKPGGVVIDICEAFCIGLKDDQRESRNQVLVDFRDKGINEQSFTQRQYATMYARSGFNLFTFLPYFDRPTDTNPGRHWIFSDMKGGIELHSRRWVRVVMRLISWTPLVYLVRWYRLNFRVIDRVFIARKPVPQPTTHLS